MLKYRSQLLAVLLSALLVSLSGCSDLRQERGEDLTRTNSTEAEIIKVNLTYIKDRKGNCFAVLNNKTDGFRNTFTMASINCATLAN